MRMILVAVVALMACGKPGFGERCSSTTECGELVCSETAGGSAGAVCTRLCDAASVDCADAGTFTRCAKSVGPGHAGYACQPQ